MFRYTRENSEPKDFVVLVDHPSRLTNILCVAHTLAHNRGGKVQALVMGESGQLPDWFTVPPGCDPARIVTHVIGRNADEVLRFVNRHKPAVLFIGLSQWNPRTRFMVSEFIDPIVQHARCTVALMKAPPDWEYPQEVRSFVPMWDDSSSRFALDTALAANPKADITVGIPHSLLPSDPSTQDYRQQIDSLIHPWEKDPRVNVKVVESEDKAAALVEEAQRYDVALLGASRGNVFSRTIFGDPRHRFAELNPGVTLIIREYQGAIGSVLYRAWSGWERLMPTLGTEDRAEIYRQVRRAGRPTRDFFMMIALSAGIASLGLVLNSPAVIIGAMLVAPLMSAIMGMGMAVVHGDLRFLLTCFRASLKGALAAIATGLLIALIAPLNDVTSEMMGRTEPTYLDLLVALVSGIAGAYALSRRDVSNALPGVAIAVALVPPLATVGISLGYGEFKMAYGALLLYLTNLSAITLASASVFAALGFRPSDARITDRDKARMTERSVLAPVVIVALVGVVLLFESLEKLQEYRTERMVNEMIPTFLESIDVGTSVWTYQIDKGANYKHETVSIVLNASRALSNAESAEFRRALSERLGREVNLVISVLPTTVIRAAQ